MTGFWSIGTEDQNFKAVISTFFIIFDDFHVIYYSKLKYLFMNYDIFDSIMIIVNMFHHFKLRDTMNLLKYL